MAFVRVKKRERGMHMGTFVTLRLYALMCAERRATEAKVQLHAAGRGWRGWTWTGLSVCTVSLLVLVW